MPMIALESIKPKLEKIFLSNGFNRLFSGRSLVEFVKAILKLAIFGAVATLMIMPEFKGIERLP
jgi:flagellar biosynthetic protein FlhB